MCIYLTQNQQIVDKHETEKTVVTLCIPLKHLLYCHLLGITCAVL